MGCRSGESLGGPPGGQQMVFQGGLADAVSVLSSHAPAAAQGDQDVGPLVLYQSCMRDRIRCGDRLFLWLGWISLSGVRVFLFDRPAPGWSAMDSRALHLRF